MLLGHLEVEDDLDGQGICQDICEDVQSGVAEVKDVDVDAFSRSCTSPGFANRLTLECSNKNEGKCLRCDDSHHDPGKASEVAISKSSIEPQNGCFDESKSCKIEH